MRWGNAHSCHHYTGSPSLATVKVGWWGRLLPTKQDCKEGTVTELEAG